MRKFFKDKENNIYYLNWLNEIYRVDKTDFAKSRLVKKINLITDKEKINGLFVNGSALWIIKEIIVKPRTSLFRPDESILKLVGFDLKTKADLEVVDIITKAVMIQKLRVLGNAVDDNKYLFFKRWGGSSLIAKKIKFISKKPQVTTVDNNISAGTYTLIKSIVLKQNTSGIFICKAILSGTKLKNSTLTYFSKDLSRSQKIDVAAIKYVDRIIYNNF